MRFFTLLITIVALTACVPAKKYNELLETQKVNTSQLNDYKTKYLDNDAQLKTTNARIDVLESELDKLKSDTTRLGHKHRVLRAKYKSASDLSADFEAELSRIKNADAKQLAAIRTELEAKMIELQQKEDELQTLEEKLKEKQRLLADREQRVEELEGIIARQDQAVKDLKEKIASALRGYEDKGLTVEERDGKIYVSLEAKLLFPVGSTEVSAEGVEAISKLAQAIENESEMEIIVEGHTDTQALAKNTHPKNNWELSVLRATEVISIMLKNSEVNPVILSAAGRSEFHPVSTDLSKNRRIEVIIAPRLDKIFELISK